MQLYNYFRSSASFRVRIALELKGLSYDYIGVQLQRNEQLNADYALRIPLKLVPLLVDGEHTISQSLAIIEYLDETHPEPALLPADPLGRARVRSLALDIACEIHPLDNLRVLRYLVKDLGVSDDAKNTWYRHWVDTGLAALERRLALDLASGVHAGPFCHGTTPTLADCVLVPQIFNARRFNCALDGLPTVMSVFDACMALPAFQAAQPSRCPDNEA